MVEYYKLDKVLSVGTTYRTPPDRFYVIKKIGTDASSDCYLKIDGVDTGPIISTVAPMHKTSSNLLGPLDLGDLYYVIPPNKTFTVEGPSGAKMRIIGLIGKLAPGEAIPGQFAARFNAQGKHYLTYVQGSYSVGTDVAWSADVEYEVYSLTPRTIEVYNFNNVAMASVAGGSFNEGQIALRLYYDGTPLDMLTSEPGPKGIDVLSMPHPPADSTEEEPFTFADKPIQVLGDHTFTVKAVNVSGGTLTPATGSSWTITFTAIVEYLQK